MDYYWDKKFPDISDMVGKTFTSVRESDGKYEMTFENEEEKYVFYHSQDCCENVRVEEVVGDLSDLEGSPILRAEEVSSEGEGPPGEYSESYTWTFYKFATIKGEVVVRWLGESNGYYSESVSMRKEEK